MEHPEHDIEALVVDCHPVDGGDLACFRVLILLRREIEHLAPGAVVCLTTTDPVAPIDLPAWCRLTGHEYLGPVPGRPTPTYGVRVAAAPHATRPDRPWHRA
ncbi:sulfurtransferase TusA family protein [Nocardioides alkalitolerans]|uniref:sulfurtransferase TusA family protein n=1 Tax=Nocardioides alkalitolerans TaxID=281714 RepID=UPI00041EF337|nr:sulfurtransferase TusA family protein [Nocardioides alkalitolerans]